MSCFGGCHQLVTDRKRKNNEVEMKFVSRAKEVGELRSGHDGGMKEERGRLVLMEPVDVAPTPHTLAMVSAQRELNAVWVPPYPHCTSLHPRG